MVRLCVVALVLLGASGCRGKGNDEAQAGTVEAAGASQQAADDLLARRDALMKSRQQLQEEREELEQERAQIVERGGDTAEVDRKLAAHRTQEEKIASEETAVADQMMSVLSQVKTAGDVTAQVAAREQAIGQREDRMSDRERKLADREALLASREAQLAERERTTCSGGGGGTTIITTVDPKAKYSKRDVEKSLKQARELMAKKGILASDLPAQAAGLEREATKALAAGDNGPARFAAAQLYETVKAISIDRAFIGAKMNRLSRSVAGKQLGEANKREVEELLVDATGKYGDGDYAGANRKLNQIWRAID
jgi:hypothetical protein